MVRSRAAERKAKHKYYLKNRETILNLQRENEETKNQQRNYRRQHILETKDGVIHRGLNKRPWTGYCEICFCVGKLLVYHHWDEYNLNKGIWVCNPCHMMAEGCDTNLIGQYMRLKDKINDEFDEEADD
ncbi:unnamed protein product [marine sediment metagenome]|uniref:Uncharacterized protein n=1 Tax=marine sediment metagenome TaxID=412755 RepID=X1JP13_9ZZZZ